MIFDMGGLWNDSKTFFFRICGLMKSFDNRFQVKYVGRLFDRSNDNKKTCKDRTVRDSEHMTLVA